MRIANVGGRAHLANGEGAAIDVETASAGRFSSSSSSLFDRWDEFRSWAEDVEVRDGTSPTSFGAPSPTPRQVFAVAVNYVDHAAEGNVSLPTHPSVFTKFPSSIVGSDVELVLPGATVDWEAELVIVIGRRAERVSEADSWSYVAGVTAGQDISERTEQFRPPSPQFSLAKSFPGFGPTGPTLVTPDEFADPNDIGIACAINGIVVQNARSSDMHFSVPEIIARLSRNCALLPGDLIFTGTPAGVGMSRDPQVFLSPGDVIETTIEGVGTLTTRVAGGE